MSWERIPLRHATVVLGRGTAPDYCEVGPVRMISQAANQGARIDWDRTRFHAYEGDPRKLKGFLQAGDSLVNSTGTGTLGRVGWFSSSPDSRPCVADGHVTLVRFDPKHVHDRFGYYFLNSDSFQNLMFETLVSGSTNQIELSRERMLSVPIPVPSVVDQRAIADFLDVETARIDDLVAKKIALVGLLKSKLQASVEEFALKEGGSKEGGSKKVPLKRVASVERGRFNHRPRNEPSLYGGDFPFVQTGDIRSAVRYIDSVGSYLSADGVAVSRSFPAGTTLMGIAANVGDVAISSFEVWCPDSVVGFMPGKMMDANFLYYMLKGLRSIINETSTENTQENTNIERLGLLSVPLLSLSDQNCIVSGLRSLEDRVDGLTARINRQIDLLKEHRQALITAAVTGEMEV